MSPDLSKTFEWSRYFANAGSVDPDAKSIEELHQEARAFLGRFNWCQTIV
jgi:hypothetical protein